MKMSLLRVARLAARPRTSLLRPLSCRMAINQIHTSRVVRCDAAAAEKPAAPEITSAKVQTVYDAVLTLNLMETVELVDVLKHKFGYVEVAVSAAPAAGGPAAAAAPVEEEKPPEKTEFNVRLNSFAAGDKIKIIKEVRTLTGLGLKQAKDLVESAPDAIIKKDCPKAEAEELMEKLKALGGEIILE